MNILKEFDVKTISVGKQRSSQAVRVMISKARVPNCFVPHQWFLYKDELVCDPEFYESLMRSEATGEYISEGKMLKFYRSNRGLIVRKYRQAVGKARYDAGTVHADEINRLVKAREEGLVDDIYVHLCMYQITTSRLTMQLSLVWDFKTEENQAMYGLLK